MNYYEQEYRSRSTINRGGNPLVTLIVINLSVFVLFSFIKVIYYFNQTPELYNQEILNWFTLPAAVDKLISRPWVIITHMFLHDRVWHVFGNMLWLWAFGFILKDLTGNRKVVPIYIYGALAGAVAFIFAFNFFNVFKSELPVATALGASAGVMAVAVATTVLAPGYRIFPMIYGGIPLWVLTLLFVIIDFATIPYNNPGGHLAHLAGAFMGFLFIFLSRKGIDLSAGMNHFFDWVNDLFNPDRPVKGKVIKSDIFKKPEEKTFSKKISIPQQQIDQILDKINQKGYEHLSEEEKEILKKASQEEL